MCGRFTQADRAESIARAFGAMIPAGLEPPRPSWNVAPSRDALVVASAGARESGPAGRRLIRATWGFLPSWARNPLVGARPINARIETAAQKPFYRDALKHGRCLIPCEGFYEWQQEGAGELPAEEDGATAPPEQLPLFGENPRSSTPQPSRTRRHQPKTPWYFRPRASAWFALAGLWAEWRPAQAGPGAGHVSFGILTTAPNELMKPIHDRMPVLVPPDRQDLWLADRPLDDEELSAFARPADAALMECWRVRTRVNHPGTDDADLVQPVRDGEPG